MDDDRNFWEFVINGSTPQIQVDDVVALPAFSKDKQGLLSKDEQGDKDLASSLLEAIQQGLARNPNLAATLLEAIQQGPDYLASSLLLDFSKDKQGQARTSKQLQDEARRKGGLVRAARLSPERRLEISRSANAKRAEKRRRKSSIGFRANDGMPD